MIELGNTTNAAADYCLVYNYYANVGDPTGCAVPAQSTDNNGGVRGVFDQDNVNTSLSHTEAYSYDVLNRLTNAVATGNATYNLTFIYDRWGNMTCQINGQTGGPCPQYSFNSANNRITNSGFSYDAAGDQLADSSYTYQYDAEERVTKMMQGSSTYSELVYNAHGQAVETTYPVYNNTEVVGVFGPAGRELGYYDGASGGWYDRDIWAAGRMVAQSYPADTYFLHANQVNSDTQITDYSGAVQTDFVYYPWQIWKYAGSQVDAHFAGFQQGQGPNYPTPTRQYSGNEGRWLSPDPLGGDITNPQSFNRYAYVLNNPTTLTDPSGLDPCDNDPNTCVTVTATPPPDIKFFVFGVSGGCTFEPYLCESNYYFQLLSLASRTGTLAPPPKPAPNIITWPRLQNLVQQNNESNLCDDVVDCIVFKESTTTGGFNANALGKAYTYFGVPQQARGLMQVTQGGAEIVNNLYHLATSGSALYQGLFNPAINVQAGSDLLQHDYDRSPLNLWQALNDYGGSRTGAYALDVLRCVEQLQEGSFAGAGAAAHGR